MRNSMIRWISRVMYVEEMTIFKDYSNASIVNMLIATPIAIQDSIQTSIEPGSKRWQRSILPLNYHSLSNKKQYY